MDLFEISGDENYLWKKVRIKKGRETVDRRPETSYLAKYRVKTELPIGYIEFIF
jgi:hypothetical protein